jgi:hypothetical protein
MENRERTCLLHWTTLLRRHTQKYIKPDMQDQHNRLCKQYKDSDDDQDTLPSRLGGYLRELLLKMPFKP